MTELKPYDTANIPGPKMAREGKPAVVAKLVGKAKRPLLIVGKEILENSLLEHAINIGKKGVTIAATAHSIKGFREASYTDNVHTIGIHELTNNLRDPEWKGMDGKGNYDMVLFMGITYYLSSQMMAALKNFAPHLTAISIDRYYHPNAEFSYANMKVDELKKTTKEMLAAM